MLTNRWRRIVVEHPEYGALVSLSRDHYLKVLIREPVVLAGGVWAPLALVVQMTQRISMSRHVQSAGGGIVFDRRI